MVKDYWMPLVFDRIGLMNIIGFKGYKKEVD
jgi:hypothetical protein